VSIASLTTSRRSRLCVSLRLQPGVASDNVEPAVEEREVLGGTGHQLRPAENRIERRSQLVRHHRHEFVLDPAGALGLGAGRSLSGEQPLALGYRSLPRRGFSALVFDVTEDEDHAQDGASRIPNGIGAGGNRALVPVACHEHHVGVEGGAMAGVQHGSRRTLDGLSRSFVDDTEDVVERAARRVRDRPPGQVLGGDIEVGHQSARVGGNHGVGDAVQRDAEPGPLRRQRRHRAIAFGDIARHLRRADDVAGLVAHRRNRERNVDPATVLPHANGLEVVDPLAGSDAGEDVRFFVLALGRNEDVDRLADQLVGRIAEDPLGRGIAGLDDAVEVFRENRVLGGLDDRGEIAAWIACWEAGCLRVGGRTHNRGAPCGRAPSRTPERRAS
jgi:hypothetical protein